MSLSIEMVLLSLISAVVGGLIVAFANHVMTRQREQEKKASDVRIEYLIDCWMKIERAACLGPDLGTDMKNNRLDELELAIAKVILLGDVAEVGAAKKFARDLAAGSNASVRDLLDSLRDSLREKLGLQPAGALDLFFRMQREKK